MSSPNIFDDRTLVSDLVTLRPLELSDTAAIVIACNDSETQRWLPLPFPYSEENARWFINDFAHGRLSTGQGLVRAIEFQGLFAGVIDTKRVDWSIGECEIGYWACPWARGHGVMTSALNVFSEWLITDQGFQRVEVRVAPENRASQKVAEKSGFTREGIARSAGITHGGRVDLIIYSKISADLGDKSHQS
jgi:ribosomal-protein-serine acetyltransferase